ncbi:hypothetical protein IV203_020564 [Nitzschia inconspicua]|uniref:Uncharacterized protein n=1 Tax=Nitzschia inconspicua TaxID=303405 RepID=A0A9K3KFG6_9STRA|nr:hypothetical protein IV203_020564 [Nitzschia inconspicua]
MSTDLRKRAGGITGASPRAASSPMGNGYHRPSPGGGISNTSYVAPPGPGAVRPPPPPPFQQQQQQSSPSLYHPTQQNTAVPVATTNATPHYNASSYHPPARPAYNYSAPAGPASSSSLGYGGTSTNPTSQSISSSSSRHTTYGGYAGGGGGGGGVTAMTSGTNHNGNYAFANNSNNNNASRMDDNKYNKKKKSRSNSGSSGHPDLFMMLGLVVLTVYGIVTTILFVSARGKTNRLLKQLDKTSVTAVIDYTHDLENRLTSTQRDLNRAKQEANRQDSQKIVTLQKENRLLQKQADDMRKKHESPEKQRQSQRWKERELAFSEQVEWLQAAARRESKRTVLERFGPGPHQVEISYALGYVSHDYDDTSPPVDDRPRHSFIVELAPLDLVPHAVHLFLEQVEHGLWNGTYFYLNGPHIVQAGPQVDDDEHDDYEDIKTFDAHGQTTNNNGDPVHVAAAKSLKVWNSRSADEEDGNTSSENNEYAQEDRRMRRFAELGLEKLAFPDYSPEFPHVTWTLGYTGRPGGPDWYINKVDNTKGHGPGGQSQHPLEEQGDSCFGRVVEGQGRNDLAQHIFGAPIYDDRTEWHYFLAEPVEIVGAVILTKKPDDVKIDMGTPLHRQDFIHNNNQPFGSVLSEALGAHNMNPVDSDPNAKKDGAVSETQNGSNGQQQQERRIPDANDASSGAAAADKNNNLDANHPPKDRAKRKPILPKIEGQAEA